jgi:hypothetical protein
VNRSKLRRARKSHSALQKTSRKRSSFSCAAPSYQKKKPSGLPAALW